MSSRPAMRTPIAIIWIGGSKPPVTINKGARGGTNEDVANSRLFTYRYLLGGHPGVNHGYICIYIYIYGS